MKIPSSLKIGGHVVNVLLIDGMGNDCGSFDLTDNTIRLDKTMTRDNIEVTFIHEILHTLNHTLDSDVMGHAFIESISEQLYQVLKDNDMLK